MLSNKNYGQMTLEELVLEESKMKSQKSMTAVFIGLLVGIAIYSATHKGFLLPIMLMIVAFGIGYKHSQSLKDIQAELSRRNTLS